MPSLIIPHKDSYCLVSFDAQDEDLIRQHNWCMNGVYAGTRINGKFVFMHRMILGLDDPRTFGDHKDGNTLNNCRSNLRAATPSQNRRNSRKEKNCTSIYKGSYFEKERGRYHAQIGFATESGAKVYNLGRYTDQRMAGKMYDKKAIELFGDYAGVNFASSKDSRQLKFPWI